MATVWESELWHGHALIAASNFLPEDCPLIEHIARSYTKHYIGPNCLLTNLSNKVSDYTKHKPNLSIEIDPI
jgi:hypothetical protein